MAATAIASPMVPDTMMNGRSNPFSFISMSAAGALKRGIE